MADLPPREADGIVITRIFEAPRERVWAEWTDPEAFADWFGGTESEVPIATVSMDVRVGGRFSFTMYGGPARHETAWKGEYLEVVEPERLVFTISDRSDEERYELCTVLLTELEGGRTEMHFEQRGWMTPEQYERAGNGWGVFFDRLEARLRAAA